MGDLAEKKQFPALDLAKFVLAILVVAIHVEPFTGVKKTILVYAIARIADPLFFAITAFLMFQKAYQNNFEWRILVKYMKRVGTLYFMWVILYMPLIVELSGKEVQMGYAFAESNLPFWSKTLLFILQKIIFIGPYGALWFLTALLLAIPLTFLVGKIVGSFWCMVISFPWFLLSILDAYGINIGSTGQLTEKVKDVFGWMGNGLTFGFFFCAMGMHAAWLYSKNSKTRKCTQLIRGIVIIFFLILLITETIWGISKGVTGNGSMLSLIPLTWFCLRFLIYANLQQKPYMVFIRKMSILIFVLHYAILNLTQILFQDNIIINQNRTIQYGIVLMVTLSLAVVIIRLSKRFKVLKVLY